MEGQQPARRHRLVLVGLVILGLFGAPAAWAAPTPEARVLLDTDRYVVGSKWTLDLLLDTPDPLAVRMAVPALPPQLVLVDGPYIRETSWEKVPGTLSRATKVSFTLRVQAPGIAEIGPFEVRIAGQTQTVAPVTVYLLAADEAKRRFPVELRWVVPEGPFYEGQAVPLMLQARNLDTLAQPEDLVVPAPPGSLWERAVGLGEIEINSVGEDRLMNVPWGGWMLIPTKKGPLTVPAVKASVAGLTRTVPPLTLDVAPLPAEAAAGRAVGDFSYSIDAKPGEGAQGGQLIVVQEISGRGNFSYLVLPEVTAPGLTLTSRQEGTRYRAAKGGYEGSLVVTWRFTTDQNRTVALSLPGFAAFRPSTGKIDVWDSRSVSVTIGAPVSAPAPAEARRALDWAGVLAVRPWASSRSWWTWLLFLPGPLFLGATFFVKGPGRGLLVLAVFGLVLSGAGEAPPAGFDEARSAEGYAAADRWDALTQAHPDEPGLWYNKALACEQSGRTAEAVHAFRTALITGFQGPQAAAALADLEAKELLTDQFFPWAGWPTSLLFLGLCLSMNLAFGFWALQRLSGSALWLVPICAAFLAAGGFGLAAGAAEAARTEPDAVIGLADGPIKKVPGDLAEAWMTLKAGTVVKVLGASDRWALVQTGYGLEGWVEASGLLRLVR